MIGNDQSLNIIVRLKDEASKQLEGFKGKIEGLQPTFTKMAAVGTAAFVGIAAVAKKSIDSYAEVERANRQLEHAVVGVSHGTLDQVKAIDSVAQALQKKVGVDADSVKMGAAQLSTFGLQSESVVQLTKTLADYTVNQDGLNASSDQYISSANIFAKALQGQFGILEKSGIRFTEAQQNLILYGTETEKVAALQEGLAQNLRETTDTVSGLDVAQAKLKRTMEDIQENIGKALAPAFASVAEKLQPLIEKFAEWAENNPELLSKIILIVGAVAGLVAVLGAIGLILPTVIAGFLLLISPIGIVIALLVTAAVLIITKWKDIKGGLEIVWEGIKNGFKATVNFLIGLAEGWANMWVKAANVIIGALNKVQFSLPDWIPGIGGKSFGINIQLAKEVSLPLLEHGGMIDGPRGTPVPIIAHGGEQIIPAGNVQNGSGINVSLVLNYPSFKTQDDIEVVKKQVEDAFRDVVRIYKLQSI